MPKSTAALSAGPVGHGLSAVVFPGQLVANPQALADSAGYATPFKIPGWPLRAEADTAGPTETNDTSTVPGAVMHARAKDEVVTADTSYPSWSQAVADFGSSRTTSTVKREGNLVVSESRSVLHDIGVLGGLIHVESLTATARATSNGKKGTTKGDIRFTGVTVAGQAATIDGSGVHFTGSPTSDLVRQARAVMDALAAGGITVRIGEPVDQHSGPLARRTAPGLMIESTMNAGGTPLGAVLDRIPANQLIVPSSPFQLADALAVLQGTQLTRVFVGATQVSADSRPAVAFGADLGGLSGDITAGLVAPGSSPGAATAGSDGSPLGGSALATAGAPTSIGAVGAPARQSSPLSSTRFAAVIIAFLLSTPLLAPGGRRLAPVPVGNAPARGAPPPGGTP